MTLHSTRTSGPAVRDVPREAAHEGRARTELFSAWSGLVAVVLFAAGSLWAGAVPKPDASTGDVTAFLVQHRSALLLGTALILLSVPFFGCFVGLLGSVLREAEGGRAPLAGAATLGWTLLLAVASAGVLVQAALTWRGAGQVDASTVRFAYDVSNLSLYAVSATAVALSVGATAFVILRTGIVAPWIAMLGLVEVVVNVVELGGLASRTGSDAAGYAAGVGPFLWAVWVGVLAVALARAIGREPVASRSS